MKSSEFSYPENGCPAETAEGKRKILPVPWLSGILATLIATFITLAVLPNTDRPRMDNSISPTRFYIEPQPLAACVVLALAFLPVVCIFFLSRRWKYFEYLAWVVLIFLAASLVF